VKKKRIELKFPEPLDPKFVRLLTLNLGYRFFSKNCGQWIIYVKDLDQPPVNEVAKAMEAEDNVIYLPQHLPMPTALPVTPEDGPVSSLIDEGAALILNRECISICEAYYGIDDADKNEISNAIKAYAQSKGNPLHREWITDWAVNNIDNVTNDQLPF
jgi:hypothetical protein